jgi:1-pyrroline-5-carboxylate dehydrogenase
MSNSIPRLPLPQNEPVLTYAPGSPEKLELKATLAEILAAEPPEIPLWIGGKEVWTGRTVELRSPHDHGRVLAKVHVGGAEEAQAAIEAGLAAREKWAALPWQERAAVFRRASELLAGPFRQRLNATTMLGQSKNCFQAEIDAACELIDFWRFNCYFAEHLYRDQPLHSPNSMWNRSELRGLEGFVFAIAPFNFTSIAGNLPTAPALMGNVVLWKPSRTQVLSAWELVRIWRAAGLPDGVINMINTDNSALISETALNHPELSGVHFTGSTRVFQMMQRRIGEQIDIYKSYPRVVGETGGKDFVVAHPSADVPALITALTRGAFEYQGQKCSAASRAYIPASLWEEVKAGLERDLGSISMGSPLDFRNFMNAVIDERAFTKISAYIEQAKESDDAEVVIGGECDRSVGWFIQPTVILAKTPDYTTLCEEIFGPVLTVYVYPDAEWSETLSLCDRTSPYALTGAVFSTCRYAIEEASRVLVHAAGNFYVNDKPTGAVVGQQPFGGARASGTNDKAGSWLNLIRWASPRSIKETFAPPTDYRYPFLAEE